MSTWEESRTAVLGPLSLAADVKVGIDVCAERRTQLHLLSFEAEARLGRAVVDISDNLELAHQAGIV